MAKRRTFQNSSNAFSRIVNCPETMTCKGQAEDLMWAWQGESSVLERLSWDPVLRDSGRISTHCKSQLHSVVLSSSAESSESGEC